MWRAGVYSGDTVMAAFDYQEEYLRAVLSFFGITNVIFVRAEGIAIGKEQRDQALTAAHAEIAGFAA